MKFKLRKASDWKFGKEIEVNTLAELKAIEDCDECVIIDFESMVITIYDDYIE